MERKSSGGRTLKTVGKAFAIFRLVKAREGMRLTELADEFDESKGTMHTYLNTLRNEGFLRKDGSQYHTTLEWFKQGSQIRDKEPLYRYGKDPADTLAQDSGELVHLAVEQQSRTYYIYSAQGNNASEPATPVGDVRPLHAVSAGKAMLATMPKSKREEILREHAFEPVTEKTIVEPKAFLKELDQIIDQGYALNDEEELLGSRAVAVSVTHPEGGVAGAICASGPKTRFDDEYIDELVPSLKETADQIEINFQRE